MNTLKPAVFALATALASASAFADQSENLPKEQSQESTHSVSGGSGNDLADAAIDNFLAQSRRYLSL